MKNITVVAVGKIKESYFREATMEYVKRLTPFVKISFLELKPEPFYGEGDKEKAKRSEGERILAALEKRTDSQIFILDEQGKNYSSEAFARHLDFIERPTIFVIGGAHGLHEDVLKKYRNTMSLSPMTFPHEMARMILVEQIYRAATIIKGKSYHH